MKALGYVAIHKDKLLADASLSEGYVYLDVAVVHKLFGE